MPNKNEIMDNLIDNHNYMRLSNTKFDVDRMLLEIEAAKKKHPFLPKINHRWFSIPLRSVGGEEGAQGNLGGGSNNSSDPNVYKYTSLINDCPYIKETLESFGGPLLKVRVMKLMAGKKIGTHIDNFVDPKVLRYHIPLVTNKDVQFIIENENKNLEAGYLYWINCRKLHSVRNNGKKDRIHIVFDIHRNENIEELFAKNQNNYL